MFEDFDNDLGMEDENLIYDDFYSDDSCYINKEDADEYNIYDNPVLDSNLNSEGCGCDKSRMSFWKFLWLTDPILNKNDKKFKGNRNSSSIDSCHNKSTRVKKGRLIIVAAVLILLSVLILGF